MRELSAIWKKIQPVTLSLYYFDISIEPNPGLRFNEPSASQHLGKNYFLFGLIFIKKKN
jgi:hypothetical protein